MLGSNLNEFKFSQIDKNFRFKLRGQKNLHIAMQVSSWKTYLLIYSFFSSVMCSNQDFVLLCVKVREKGKKKKKKGKIWYGQTTQELLELGRTQCMTLEPILPKITPKTLGWFLQTLQRAWEHEVQHSQRISVVDL